MDCSNCQYRYNQVRSPHILPNCGHTFCIDCLTSLFTEESVLCPQCSTQSSSKSPIDFPLNQALFQLNSSVNLCELHQKPIEAFCEYDKKLVCVRCILEQHQSHSMNSIDKAVSKEKHDLHKIKNQQQRFLQLLLSKDKEIEKQLELLNCNFKKTMDNIKKNYFDIKQKIQDREDLFVEEITEIYNKEHHSYTSVKKQTHEQLTALRTLYENINDVFSKDDISILNFSSEKQALYKLINRTVEVPQFSNPFENYSSYNEFIKIQSLFKSLMNRALSSPVGNLLTEKNKPSKTKDSLPMKSKQVFKNQTHRIQGRLKTPQTRLKWKLDKEETLTEDSGFFELGSLYKVPSQYVYTIGGLSDNSCPLPVEIFDISKNRWEREGNYALNRTKFAAVAYKHDILVLGGKQNSQELDTTEMLSLFSGQPTPGNITLPSPVSAFGCVSIQNNILLAGGREELPTRSARKFDGERWMSLPSLSHKREDLALVLGPDLSLYALGGSDASSLSVLERLDLREQSWHSLPSMSVPRSALAAVSLPDGIYAFGGYNSHQCLNTAEKFEIRMNKWIEIAQMAVPRYAFTAVTSQDCQHVYTIGGFNQVGVNTVEKYSVVNDQWSQIQALKAPRFMHASLLILDK